MSYTYMDFQDVQTSNTADLFLFPNRTCYTYWTTTLSKQYGCIPLDNFITTSQLQHRLHQYIYKTHTHPIRILNTQEQLLIMSILLKKPEAQQYICSMEQMEVGSLHIPIQYAEKLLRILQQYISYRSLPNDKNSTTYTHAVDVLLQMYNDILSQYHCTDSIGLSTQLHIYIQKHTLVTSQFHCKVFYPQLFIPQDRLWIEHFGTEIVASSMPAHDTSPSNNRLFSYTHVPTNDSDIPLSTITYPPHLMHKISSHHDHRQETEETISSYSTTKINPVFHEYTTINNELESIFSAISILINGRGDTPPQANPNDIMLTICNKEKAIDNEIIHLSKKYQVPIPTSHTHTLILNRILFLIDEVQRTHYSLSALQNLLLEPSLPWKHRSIHLDILSLGLRSSCINNSQLKRWDTLLFQNAKLSKYFQSFTKTLRKIVDAPSFQILYNHMHYFCTQFFNHSVRTLGAYDTEEEHYIGNMLLKAIETNIVFEKNIAPHTTSLFNTSAWNILCTQISNISTSSRKGACIHISTLEQSLGTEYPYWFVCNVSQSALTSITTHYKIFNDFLSDKYKDEHEKITQDTIIRYLKAILQYITQRVHHIYISGATVGINGAQLPPLYWEKNRVNTPSYQFDIWVQEQQYWAKHHTSSSRKIPERISFPITPAQKKGIQHQYDIGMYHKKPSLKKEGIDRILYQNILTSSNVTLHPSSISALFNPHVFLFEYILHAVETLPKSVCDRDMHEYQSWGNVYHALLEKCILYEQTHTTPKIENIDPTTHTHTDIESNSIAYLETVLGTSLPSFFTRMNIPHSIWNSFSHILSLCNFKEHASYIQALLSKCDNKGKIEVEKTKKISLKEAFENILDEHASLFTTFPLMLKGRVDLLYKLSNDTYYIMDFKRKYNKNINTLSLFQLWTYYLIWNNKYLSNNVATNDMSFHTNTQYMGNIYFLNEEGDERLYPQTQQTEEHLSYHDFAHTLKYGLLQIYNMAQQNNDEINEDTILQEILPTLQKDISLSTQCILRERGYIYVK